MSKQFLILGSINGCLAVALGAFGAHGLKARISPELLAVYQTAVQYHTTHTLALLAVGILAHWLPSSIQLQWAGWLFLVGIILFSGSLYLLSAAGLGWLGAITPIGGTAFLAGWILLGVVAFRA